MYQKVLELWKILKFDHAVPQWVIIRNEIGQRLLIVLPKYMESLHIWVCQNCACQHEILEIQAILEFLKCFNGRYLTLWMFFVCNAIQKSSFLTFPYMHVMVDDMIDTLLLACVALYSHILMLFHIETFMLAVLRARSTWVTLVSLCKASFICLHLIADVMGCRDSSKICVALYSISHDWFL